MQKVPKSQILEDARKTTNNQRGKYLERQDIVNVALEYGLDRPYSLHKNDEISTKLHLEDLQEQGEYLFFKGGLS